jgi:hormone-sensitive lipase
MGSNLITPYLSLNTTKNINLNSVLRIKKTIKSTNTSEKQEEEYVDILPPSNSTPNDFVRIRILSNEIRKGMEDLDKLPTTNTPTNEQVSNNEPQYSSSCIDPSKYLMLHCHGGGFIAHSSKSHEIYLKPWAKELKIPIVSIDYSLSPENHFPRASEECNLIYIFIY